MNYIHPREECPYCKNKIVRGKFGNHLLRVCRDKFLEDNMPLIKKQDRFNNFLTFDICKTRYFLNFATRHITIDSFAAAIHADKLTNGVANKTLHYEEIKKLKGVSDTQEAIPQPVQQEPRDAKGFTQREQVLMHLLYRITLDCAKKRIECCNLRKNICSDDEEDEEKTISECMEDILLCNVKDKVLKTFPQLLDDDVLSSYKKL